MSFLDPIAIKAISVLPAFTMLAVPFSRPQIPKSLDESWTVTVSGQTVPANADGTFTVPNVSTPDQFGEGGPGTPPDFLSDDAVRAVACGQVDGVTWWAFSEPFRLRSGETYHIGDLTFTSTTPLLPTSISLSLPSETLLEGQWR